MAENTAIEWTDATFNPWWGCQKVSPACDHCYAERDAARFAPARVLWGVGAERRTFDDKHWVQPLKWAKRSFVSCTACGWRGMHTKLNHEFGHHRCPQCRNDEWRPARMRVFCASMADWLDLDAPLDQFVRLLDTIRRTPELDWLLLSKRIGNWRKRLSEAANVAIPREDRLHGWINDWLHGIAPEHVWIGATVVDQAEADRDVPKLLATPARVRFLSVEPMLGPMDLSTHRGARALPLYWEGTPTDGPMPNYCSLTGRRLTDTTRRGWVKTSENMSPWVDWVIAGGESGPHARPMHPDWARSLRDQCAAAGVPFLFKQWGEWVAGDSDGALIDADESSGIALDERRYTTTRIDYADFVRVGKKAAGRQLDGRTHDGFPA